jgi:L-alanine-DL-glutamate epimerase-like enolase superfamily enzyme
MKSGSGPRLRRHDRATDICVKDIDFSYEEHSYRTPIKFGGVAVDRATILNVECVVETAAGRAAQGFGSMPLGNVWAFPSKTHDYDTTLGAMKRVAEHVARVTRDCNDLGHPIDLNVLLEKLYVEATAEVGKQLGLREPIPILATLVTASPFDAAIHDAFGKVHSVNCYRTYRPEFMSRDLEHYLGKEFHGDSLHCYISEAPKACLPVYHLVGALDPLQTSEVCSPVSDGLPETLAEWIRFNGLTHLKIKLNGDYLDWDVDRVVGVDRVACEVQRGRDVDQWSYSLDFNERCASVDYLLEFLRRVKENSPAGYERIQYIEQPTARDLNASGVGRMDAAAKLKPVVIDESLVDLESLLRARDLGYTGAALKVCKGQSQSLLMAAAAQKYGMFLCVQDLTCPGASLVHSAGLAAHVPAVTAIEANARQYMPAANAPWVDQFPGIFKIRDGTMRTESLTGPGLGIAH